MERIKRKPFQGIGNIIRFNWHFYAGSVITMMILFLSTSFVPPNMGFVIVVIASLIALSTFISLAVSFYVYDISNLYRLDWLDFIKVSNNDRLVNINAGFDETSWLLSNKYLGNSLTVFDFYNPLRHTEVSIERARKAYSVYPGTIQIDTSSIPVDTYTFDFIFIILSAHEIRNKEERILFFKELNRVLKTDGKIFIVEHLRDWHNFIAYTVGFFHFFSCNEWKKTFTSSKLQVNNEFKITPFISAFILQKDGIAP